MRRVLLVLVVAVVLLAGGCGLPDDDRPRLVADEDAPLDLAPTAVPVATGPAVGDVDVTLFFIDGEHLAPVGRSVPAVTHEIVINQLLAGLAPDDPAGLTSAIPPGTMLISASLAGGTLTLDLGPAGEGGIQAVQGTGQLQAFAQLVRTATGLSGVRDVRFQVAGVPISPLTDAGAVDRAVGRADYASLAPG